jgi:hypothetical protein
VLDEVLDLLNSEELKGIWSEDEAIGWVYQYFTPKELRDQARKESQAPRNSYELAFRNQFFTPHYVIEFLTDNTLGRIWYEMRKGGTRLMGECRYMVRRPGELFFSRTENEPDSPVRAMRNLLLSGTEETFPPFRVGETQRLVEIAHTVNSYERHSLQDQVEGEWWPRAKLREIREAGDLSRFPTQDLLDVLFCKARADRFNWGDGDWDEIFYDIANEVRCRAIEGKEDASQEELMRAITAIPHRPKKDPREIKILDPACGSGHFLLYCFGLLLIIYEEAYDDPDLGPGLQADFQTKDDLRRAVPGLILRHNLHGIDIDLRCTQIAVLALWLRCQRAYQEMGLKKDRPRITRSNIVCAEPMPGEMELLEEFLKTLQDDRPEALIRTVMSVPADRRVRATKAMADSLSDLVRTVWEKMRLAGEVGSFLKIEEELQDAIRKGQDDWEERLPLFRYTEYGLSEEPKERLVRFVAGDVDGERITFWDKAEGLVRRALDEFVEFASSGGRFQRKLFAEDAKQGLGFVDLCRQKYDAVLMNPPFGSPSTNSGIYLSSAYKGLWSDIYSAFIVRAIELLTPDGELGAITSRSFLALPSFESLRSLLLEEGRLRAVVECGLGVLDEATVRAAFFCFGRGKDPTGQVLFWDLKTTTDRAEALLRALNEQGVPASNQLCTDWIRSLPGKTFAYWLPSSLLHLLAHGPHLDGARVGSFNPETQSIVSIETGVQTGDNFRFVRCHWEVHPKDISPNYWVRFAHSVGFSRFYSPTYTVLRWNGNGDALLEQVDDKGNRIARLRCRDRFFLSGMISPYISERGLGCSYLAAGQIHGNSCRAYFSPAIPQDLLLAYLNSAVVDLILFALTPDRKHEPGIIARIPSPPRRLLLRERELREIVTECYNDMLLLRSADETDPMHFFEPINALDEQHAATQRLRSNQLRIDEIVERDFGLEPYTVEQLFELSSAPHDLGSWSGLRLDEQERDIDNRHLLTDGYMRTVISHAIGAVLGRWDVACYTGERKRPSPPDPCSVLPTCPPAVLQGPDGLPTAETPYGYPIRIDWDGILVDDPDHSDDIIRRVRDVLEVIWKDRADAIEKEACEILGVADLRDYFRKPGSGGFWDDHIKRYSKSRRKAPIYWLLQSSKKNYALWIYYHRLDKDIFFRALLNYVEPKIRREEARLDELWSQKAALGPAAKGARKLDKDIDRQKAFLSELRDFEDKLRRAANLHLDPDLNDGVVLNIAPLHELVPWKEAKTYWDDLVRGEYEWSSIAKQLREKGLVSSPAT